MTFPIAHTPGVWPSSLGQKHTLTISANGRRIYGVHLDPFTGRGGIHVVDISDMARPRYIGKFGVTRPDGSSYEFAPHEISISPDERRIYAGVIGSLGGDLNRDITTSPGLPCAARLGGEAGGIYIIDNSDIAEERDHPHMRLIGTAEHGGWHSVMQANINGVPHLVGGGELMPCPGTWPKIVNIADDRRQELIGEFRLAMNHAENCTEPTPVESGSGGIVARLGTTTIHFNDVDSATDTRLGLFNFLWAGLRIADLRDPGAPREVAYFRPGDACGGHVRYMPDTGHIGSAAVRAVSTCSNSRLRHARVRVCQPLRPLAEPITLMIGAFVRGIVGALLGLPRAQRGVRVERDMPVRQSSVSQHCGAEHVEFQVATQAFRATWREPKGAEREKVWSFLINCFHVTPIISARPGAACARAIPSKVGRKILGNDGAAPLG